MKNIQIIGTKKCNETKRALRFFKERGLKPHFADLKDRELKEGELKNITAKIDAEDLIDKDSKAFKDKGLEYMVYDAFEEILENNSIIKTPIVRHKGNVTCGYAPEEWESWI